MLVLQSDLTSKKTPAFRVAKVPSAFYVVIKSCSINDALHRNVISRGDCEDLDSNQKFNFEAVRGNKIYH